MSEAVVDHRPGGGRIDISYFTVFDNCHWFLLKWPAAPLAGDWYNDRKAQDLLVPRGLPLLADHMSIKTIRDIKLFCSKYGMIIQIMFLKIWKQLSSIIIL